MDKFGEEQIIDFLQATFQSKKEVFGIGDDCAVLPISSNRSLLFTVDALVEGIHFDQETTSFFDLGYKSLAVNVSDIAAMGGRPKYAMLSLSIPGTEDMREIKEFFSGFNSLLKTYDMSLIGGDTVGSTGKISISVTVIGEIDRENIKYRSTALAGDILCVTNFLGDSRGGLICLNRGERIVDDYRALIRQHVSPTPQPEIGAWLGLQESVHAMMDISDGLFEDVQKIMKASDCGVQIDLNKIPLSKGLTKLAAELDEAPHNIAIRGGEDYCLLVSIDRDQFEHTARAYAEKFATPLLEIGKISEDRNLQFFQSGKKVAIEIDKFDHFCTSKEMS